MHPDFPPDSSLLAVDRVEWVPLSAQALRVHLFGRWSDRPLPGTHGGAVARSPMLLVSDGGRRHGFAALPEAPVGVLMAFELPNELRPALEHDLALQVGSREIALPGATAGTIIESGTGTEPDPSSAGARPQGGQGEVIDRAVLAERRARRAELSEDAVARRAETAEQTSATLMAQLSNLEQRLVLVNDERAELEAQVAESERRLRITEQREHAEQQLRIEAQDELGLVRRAHEAESTELRERLESATRRAEELARDVERARRASAEAAQRGEADRNALRRAEAALSEIGDSSASAELLRNEAKELGIALVGERTERERLEELLEQSREAAQVELKRLEYELAGRRDVHGRILAELAAAHAELQRLRERGDTSPNLAPMPTTTTAPAQGDDLEQRVIALERRRDDAGSDRSLLREVLAERSHELERARLELRQQLFDVIVGLREAADGDRASRVELERQLVAREHREAELQRLVAEVLRTSASLRARFEAEIRELEKRMTDRLLSERAEAAETLAAAQRRIAELETRVSTAEDAQGGRDLALGLRAEAESLRSELARVRAIAERQAPAVDDPGTMIGGLAAAAARLREQTEPLTDELPDEPSLAGPRLPAGDIASTPPLEPAVARLAPAEPALAPRPIAPGQRPVSWLAPAIVRMGLSDPQAAARLVVALLPALRPEGIELAFDLSLNELGSYRVTVDRHQTKLDALQVPSPRGSVAFRLAGPAKAFAAFAAGGMRRRPKELQVTGRKRRLRKLIKQLERPLQLADLHAAGTRIDPGLLLSALAAGIDLDWTVGRGFSVVWKVSGEHAGSWTVAVRPGRVPTIAAGTPMTPATATVYVTEGGLIPLLAGLEMPTGDAASVVGDGAAVTLLREWFDRAQGLA